MSEKVKNALVDLRSFETDGAFDESKAYESLVIPGLGSVPRRGDYLSITHVWKENLSPPNKRPVDFLRLKSTKEEWEHSLRTSKELARLGHGNSLSLNPFGEVTEVGKNHFGEISMFLSEKGGDDKGGTTFVHWTVVVKYARYVNPGYGAKLDAQTRMVAMTAVKQQAVILEQRSKFAEIATKMLELEREKNSLLLEDNGSLRQKAAVNAADAKAFKEASSLKEPFVSGAKNAGCKGECLDSGSKRARDIARVTRRAISDLTSLVGYYSANQTVHDLQRHYDVKDIYRRPIVFILNMLQDIRLVMRGQKSPESIGLRPEIQIEADEQYDILDLAETYCI